MSKEGANPESSKGRKLQLSSPQGQKEMLFVQSRFASRSALKALPLCAETVKFTHTLGSVLMPTAYTHILLRVDGVK